MGEAKIKRAKCWCCGSEAYIVVYGEFPLCLECGRQHFWANRMVSAYSGLIQSGHSGQFRQTEPE